jgi:hypothetical protein
MCVYIVYNESLSRVGNNTCYLTKYLGPAVEHTLGLRGHWLVIISLYDRLMKKEHWNENQPASAELEPLGRAWAS